MEKFERDAGRHTVLSNEGCKFAYYGEDHCLLADKAPAFWGTPEGGRR